MTEATRHHRKWIGGLFVLLLLLMALIPLPARSFAQPEAPEGVVEFPAWDFAEQGIVSLTGQWEFYWGRFLEPTDFVDGAPSVDALVSLPHMWGRDGRETEHEGFATYRLRIRLDAGQARDLKALYVNEISTAYKLYINGELMAKTGDVGDSRATMEPKSYSKSIVFHPREGDNELIIQVSNFVHRKGGILSRIQFGDESDIARSRELHSSKQVFVAAALAVMGAYHLALRFLRRKDTISMLAGIICGLMTLRVMVLGDSMLALFTPWIKWEWATKVEFLTVFLGIPLIMIFIRLVYPQEVRRSISRLIVWVCSIFFAMALLTPPSTFTYIEVPFCLILIGIMGYWIYVLMQAVRYKRIGALPNLMAALVMVASVVNDILYNNHYIETMELSSYGVLLFFFVQTLVIAHKYSKAFVDVEHFSSELALMNQKLEGKIKERTEALEVTNAYLVYANEHLNQLENSRRELIANVTHELGTPMTSIQGYMKALLDGVIQPEKQYIQIIYDKIQMAERLVQDLFDLTKLEEGQTTFHMVDVIVDELFQEHFSVFKWDVEGQGIQFELIRPESVEDQLPVVRLDPIRIRQVITNLVHNALNYTDQGGTIAIRGEYGLDRLIIQVTDTGKGIDPAVLPNIFDRFVKTSGPRKYTKDGSGLGLAIAREIVMHHGGILTVQSELGKGSTFQFDIPVEFIPMVVD